MRLVDVDALDFTIPENPDFMIVLLMQVLKNVIDNAPTIDPESLRPQGEWMKLGNKIICWHCKEEPVYANLEGFILTTCCPNCGARMKT